MADGVGHCPPLRRCCEPLCPLLQPMRGTRRIEPLRRVGVLRKIDAKELPMTLLAQLSAHFWLLFAIAVSIAVVRELVRQPEEPPVRLTRRRD